MKKTNQKGITLIALIITIIVMLILVGVSVNIALDGGLFKAAQSGAKQTESERKAEEELSAGKITIGNKEYSSIESYAAGNAGIPVGLELGDEVEYTPNPPKTASNTTTTVVNSYTVKGDVSGTGSDQTFTTDTNLKWKILSMDEVTGITLIADRATTDQLTLKGMNGLNNAIDILDGICENLYSCEGIGTARSLSLDDIYAYADKIQVEDWATKKYVEVSDRGYFTSEYGYQTGDYYKQMYFPNGLYDWLGISYDNNGFGSATRPEGVTLRFYDLSYPYAANYALQSSQLRASDDGRYWLTGFCNYAEYGWGGTAFRTWFKLCQWWLVRRNA